MIYTYVVTLKNQNTRSIDLLGILISVISLSFFLRELMIGSSAALAAGIGILGMLLFLTLNYFDLKKGKKVYYAKPLLIAALVWMKMPYMNILSIVFIALALLEYQAKYAVEIGFSEQEIVINAIIKKRYPWSAFTNVVLKDGLLTMDFANNKLLQKEVLDQEDDDAEEDEFNDWCEEQLSLNIPKQQ